MIVVIFLGIAYYSLVSSIGPGQWFCSAAVLAFTAGSMFPRRNLYIDFRHNYLIRLLNACTNNFTFKTRIVEIICKAVPTLCCYISVEFFWTIFYEPVRSWRIRWKLANIASAPYKEIVKDIITFKVAFWYLYAGQLPIRYYSCLNCDDQDVVRAPCHVLTTRFFAPSRVRGYNLLQTRVCL